jgi:hypothetical protein
MVQSIYNNYSPQYNYNYQAMPGHIQPRLPSGYNDIAAQYNPQPPLMPHPVMQQFVQRVPGYIYQNYYDPQTAPVVQSIFDRSLNNQLYYPSNSVQNAVKQAPAYNTVQNQVPSTVDCCPWIQDQELKFALNKLAEITHDPADIQHLNSMGIYPPFNSGKEALDLIVNNQVKVNFADFGDSLAHAQYDNANNTISINQKYRGKMTLPMALAIACALYHEAGHAKDRDDVSSIQEELNCLALNVLGYRYQQRYYPDIINNASGDSRLINDGVALYPKLFFDSDPAKTGLINRVSEKYGFLPLTSPNHEMKNKPLPLIIKENHVMQNNHNLQQA